MDTMIFIFNFLVFVGLIGQLTMKSEEAFEVRLAFATGFVMAQLAIVTVSYSALKIFVPVIPLGTTAWLIATLLTIPLVLLIQPHSILYKKKEAITD